METPANEEALRVRLLLTRLTLVKEEEDSIKIMEEDIKEEDEVIIQIKEEVEIMSSKISFRLTAIIVENMGTKLQIVDTRNSTIVENKQVLLEIMATTLMNMKLYYWPVIVYLHMRTCPTRSVQDKTPEKAWSGRKSTVKHLKIFGCLAYAHVPDKGLKVIQMDDGIFVSQKKYAFDILKRTNSKHFVRDRWHRSEDRIWNQDDSRVLATKPEMANALEALMLYW
ncbi:hypothetical protein ZIOFF_040737 [Zingiber officinale]|uniref:Uncharacterized protein n=1 Tax=Zingiber officinale TaxID=94328 RepID=A0A8J5GA50_ZINOF|nr:hypothetical protein ZIOFF_040737 [Zingiber officinale]